VHLVTILLLINCNCIYFIGAPLGALVILQNERYKDKSLLIFYSNIETNLSRKSYKKITEKIAIRQMKRLKGGAKI
jgi:hypothetical protein